MIDDFIGDWWLGTDKQSVRQQLTELKDKHVDVKISSLGGSLDDALDIRQQFVDHGDVSAYLYGFVASAATVVAMGAKHIAMGKYALFLVHQCSNFVCESGQMNASELQALIDRMQKNKEENEKIDSVLAAMYAARCKKHSQAELLDLLKESRWLTAQEALEWGFVDEILDDDNDAPNMTNALAKKFNAAGFPAPGLAPQPDNASRLKHFLDSLKALFSDNKPAADDFHSPNSVTMNDKFTSLAGLLNVQAIAMTDGSAKLTAEQLQTVEDRLNELSSQASADAATIDNLKQHNAELLQQVKNLQKGPADVTATVDEADPDNRSLNSKQLYNTIKDLI